MEFSITVMSDAQRKLIKQLMGSDSYTSYTKRRTPELTSFKVCKSFLVGTCPHDLFVGTKQDLGRCPKLHLEKHKIEYESRRKRGEEFPDFEYEYYMTLAKYIQDIDRIIDLANKKLEHTPEEKQQVAEVTRDVETLDTKISLMRQEIDYLIAHHKTNMVLEQSIKLSKLIIERDQLGEKARTVIDSIGKSSQQKLQVCEQCGAYLSILDSDRRLADHFVGKIHIGYAQMRSAYRELHKKYQS